MDIKDLIGVSSEDIKRMEMDKQMEELKRLTDVMFDPREELLKLAEAGEIEQNPLAAYSTTELKKELRRRKGKTK